MDGKSPLTIIKKKISFINIDESINLMFFLSLLHKFPLISALITSFIIRAHVWLTLSQLIRKITS